MTNYDRIKAMNVEEMVELINVIGNEPCYPCKHITCGDVNCRLSDCLEGIKKWLESEVEPNDT